MTTLPLAPAADKPVPKSVPCPLEDDTGSTSSGHNGDSDSSTKTTTGNASSITTRLAVLADLLANLPAAARREVITSLPPTDRATIAKLLVLPQA